MECCAGVDGCCRMGLCMDSLMIVAVTGWRFHTGRDLIRGHMDSFWARHEDFFAGELLVRVGDATGADEIVLNWCKDNGIEYRRYGAQWDQFGKAAGPKRNEQMLTQEWYTRDPSGHGEVLWRPSRADLLIGFPEPGAHPKIPGSGSWNCIGQAFTLGIEILIPSNIKRGE